MQCAAATPSRSANAASNPDTSSARDDASHGRLPGVTTRRLFALRTVILRFQDLDKQEPPRRRGFLNDTAIQNGYLPKRYVENIASIRASCAGVNLSMQ
jgi:hypothetical protein